MKRVYWVIGGVIVTIAVFFISDPSGDIWSSVWAISIAAFLYLMVFSWVWLKQIKSRKKKAGIAIVLGLLLVSTGIYAYFSYKSSQRAKVLMPKNRLNFEKRGAQMSVMVPLLSTLRSYYNEGDKGIEDGSLHSLFINKYDSLLSEDNKFQHAFYSVSINLYLDVAGPDSLILVGQSEMVGGQDLEFQNYDESTGKFQVRGILTPNGIQYERQN